MLFVKISIALNILFIKAFLNDWLIICLFPTYFNNCPPIRNTIILNISIKYLDFLDIFLNLISVPLTPPISIKFYWIKLLHWNFCLKYLHYCTTLRENSNCALIVTPCSFDLLKIKFIFTPFPLWNIIVLMYTLTF